MRTLVILILLAKRVYVVSAADRGMKRGWEIEGIIRIYSHACNCAVQQLPVDLAGFRRRD